MGSSATLRGMTVAALCAAAMLFYAAAALGVAAASGHPRAVTSADSASRASSAAVWIVGQGGRIFRSLDGGANWQWLRSNVHRDLNDVEFLSRRTGYVVGRGGLALRTTNGGVRWQRLATGTGRALEAVDFVGGRNGWAVGASGVILATTDRGATWVRQAAGITTQDLEGVSFPDTQNGWAVGVRGTILHTADGGATWLPQVSSTTQPLFDVVFADAQVGWAVGGDIDHWVILATRDGGGSWVPQDWQWWADTPGGLLAADCVGPTNIWVGGGGFYGDDMFWWPTLVSSADGGATWADEHMSVGSGSINAIDFVSATHGWMVGDSTRWLYRSRDGGKKWTTLRTPVAATFYGVAAVE